MDLDHSSVRLAPLADDVASPAAASVYDEVRADGMAVPELYRMLAHAPAQLRAWHSLAAGMRRSTDLPLSVDVPVILRVAHVVGSERQWRHQVGRAEAAGLSAEQLDAIRTNDRAAHAGFDDAQRAALDVATYVARGERLPDTTWAAVLEHLGAEQAVAVVMKASYFRTLAGLLSAFDLT